MADRVAVPARGSARLSKDTLSAVAILLVVAVALRFLIHYALPYFRFDPAYFDYYWPYRMRLIFDICGGVLALSCGPFQFWTGLRRAMTFHVWTGRLYLVGVTVGSTGAFLMGVFSTPRSFGVALMFMASAWILITGIASAAIVRGLVSLHKEWMVRSYLVSFGFVTFRLVDDSLPGLARYLGGESSTTAAQTSHGPAGWCRWAFTSSSCNPAASSQPGSTPSHERISSG